MNETKFTPGPWEVSVGNNGSIFGDLNNPEHDGDNPYIGTVAGIGVDKDIPECTANAKLISACPDLLEALQEAQKALKENYPWPELHAKIQAAIDKATK